jgi:hypothetical protein
LSVFDDVIDGLFSGKKDILCRNSGEMTQPEAVAELQAGISIPRAQKFLRVLRR